MARVTLARQRFGGHSGPAGALAQGAAAEAKGQGAERPPRSRRPDNSPVHEPFSKLTAPFLIV